MVIFSAQSSDIAPGFNYRFDWLRWTVQSAFNVTPMDSTWMSAVDRPTTAIVFVTWGGSFCSLDTPLYAARVEYSYPTLPSGPARPRLGRRFRITMWSASAIPSQIRSIWVVKESAMLAVLSRPPRRGFQTNTLGDWNLVRSTSFDTKVDQAENHAASPFMMPENPTSVVDSSICGQA
jgi:hypothetical protein